MENISTKINLCNSLMVSQEIKNEIFEALRLKELISNIENKYFCKYDCLC